MKKTLLILSTLTAILISCSTSRKSLQETNPGFSTSDVKIIQDGLSFASAIVINEKREGPGVDAEYAWIKSHYSNYVVKGQSLNHQGKKSYDIIHLKLSDGKNLDLHFDITKFFGKL